nr:uncharacterized protein LOC113819220 [Penaeus vannamei]
MSIRANQNHFRLGGFRTDKTHGIENLFTLKGGAATSIRITKVKVPNSIEVGSHGDLYCEWDEGQDQMYSVKWYQGANEFYRYTPAAKDPIQVFDLVSLDVDRTPYKTSKGKHSVSLVRKLPYSGTCLDLTLQDKRGSVCALSLEN